jgi:hypothetical protein
LRRNCLLKQVIEGKIEGRLEVTRRWGRRRKQLLDDLKETRGSWILKEEALDRTLCRTRFARGYGPVVRQTTEWMNECKITKLNVPCKMNKSVLWNPKFHCLTQKSTSLSYQTLLRTISNEN